MNKYEHLTALFPAEQLAALNVVRSALLEEPTLLDKRVRPEESAGVENRDGNSQG